MLKKFYKEEVLFLLVCILHVFIVTKLNFIIPMDAFAHVYGGKILWDLLLGNEFISNFYLINPYPVPNWVPYLILGGFTHLFSPFIAMRLFLLLYLLGIPYSFRFLIKRIAPENKWASYLIFPLLFHYLFLIGFVSFSLGWMFLFLLIGVWVKYTETRELRFFFIALAMLVTLYFTHFFVYSLGLLAVGIYIAWDILFQRKKLWSNKKSLLSYLLFLGVGAFLWGLFYQYYYSFPVGKKVWIKDKLVLLDWLVSANFLPFFEPVTVFYAGVLGSIFTLMFWIVTGIVFYEIIKRKKENTSLIWLMALGVVLIGYFTYPDKNGRDAYITIRFLIACFFFLIIFIASVPKYFTKFFSITTAFMFSIHLLLFTTKVKVVSDTLSLLETYLQEAGKNLKNNKVLLPVYALVKERDQLKFHIVQYIAASKDVVALNVYPANNKYYPIIWNENKLPHNVLSPNYTYSEVPHIRRDLWSRNEKNERREIDFVCVLDNGNVLTDNKKYLKLLNILKNNYTVVYKNTDCLLYEKNENIKK